MSIYLQLLLVAAVTIYIVDLSGFTQSWRSALARRMHINETNLLLYVDCQSFRKLGKKLNLSHMTMRREVLRIRKIVLEEFNNDNQERND